MNPQQAQESAERDQLWASLCALRVEIDRIAAGDVESDVQRKVAVLLARIVASEMDYRARDAERGDVAESPLTE